MIVRKNSNLDLVPAIWYASVLSLSYSLLMVESFDFTSHDIFMGFLLGVPQLTFGFVCFFRTILVIFGFVFFNSFF